MSIILTFEGDVFFTEEQKKKLRFLMTLQQIGQITVEEQKELDSLIQAELLASIQRCKLPQKT